MNDYLLIASVLKPQGVRGECKLRSYAADIERFHQWNTLYLKNDDSYIPVALRTVRIRDGSVPFPVPVHGQGKWSVFFHGVPDRSDVRKGIRL